MSTQNPNKNNMPQHEVDESDALKQAILKLQRSGMLTHIPDELADIVEESSASIPDEQAADISVQSDSTIAPDAKTIPSRPTKETPKIVENSDDIEKHADEQAESVAVMSGWDTDNTQDSVSETEATSDSDNTLSANADTWELPSEASDNSEQSESIEDQSAITLRRKEIKPHVDEAVLTSSREKTPWALQQFFDGEIDLEQELLKRFPAMPAMTTIKFRTLGLNSSRKVATLSTQDGRASLIVDADVETKVVQLSFIFGSMMTLRYVLTDLPTNNRERWLELMRREKGGLAFLWNEDRWQEDYLICVSREYATNIFAFSPRNFESAVRITKNVTNELLTWLEDVWVSEPETKDDDDSPLLTW